MSLRSFISHVISRLFIEKVNMSAVYCLENTSNKNCSETLDDNMVGKKSKSSLKKELRKKLSKEKQKIRKQERKRIDDPSLNLHLDVSNYYMENGLRKVHPYSFTFTSNAKGRWIGRPLLEVLKEEFEFDNSPSFVDRIHKGLIRVNKNLVSPDYTLKDLDKITHLTHRHEMPVLDTPIGFIHEDEDVLIVNKPASIPVHPCGRYNLNSLICILAKEHDKRGVRFVHRLDRMTSGLMIFAKNYDMAAKLGSQVSERLVEKFYLCRVAGMFPNGDEKGEVVCSEALGVLSPKMGIQMVQSEAEGGKSAQTIFSRVSHNGATSVVLCRPRTGRTHQIRVHIQHLGYPIVNDPLYNSSAWGPEKGTGGRYHKSLDQLVTDLYEQHQRNDHCVTPRVDSNVEEPTGTHPDEEPLSKRSKLSSDVFDPDCLDCQKEFRDPERKDLILYLHAFRYKGPDWDYSTPLPDWAKEDFELCDVSSG